MNQIVNIFRKDIRHLRLELLASLAILLLFILVEPRSWADHPPSGLNGSAIMALLLWASWAILIFRLVHAERLAGLNQFWTTRPYEWSKLLAAKSLFLLVFLYTPLFLSQLYLLHRGGFPISPDLSKLLFNLLLLTSIFILPMACVAIVTRSFAEATLTLLGIAAAIAGITSAFTYLGSVSATLGLPRHSPLFFIPLQIGIAMAFFTAAILMQYRRRATLKSIVLLSTAAAVLVLTSLILKGSSAAAAGYAASVPDDHVTVSIDARVSQPTALILPKNPRTAMYRIPLLFSNFPPGATINREAQRYTLKAADGYSWTSDWIDDNDDFGGLMPKGPGTEVHTRSFIDIPWRVHDRLAGAPVSIHIDFLVSQLEDRAPYTYTLGTDDHLVPGVGECALNELESWSYVNCRVTFAQIRNIRVRTFGSDEPCDGSESPTQAAGTSKLTPESGFLIGREHSTRSPIPFVSPVIVNQVHLSGPENHNSGHLCPGVPISFSVKRFQRRLRLETANATIVLKD
jgi:hypothetical protein